MDWHQVKIFIEHSLGFSQDAVHVVAGVCLQLACAALLRQSVRHLTPFSFVLLAELANEWFDLQVEAWPDHAMQWGESAKDVALTMFLPMVLLVLARCSPRLFRESAGTTIGKSIGIAPTA